MKQTLRNMLALLLACLCLLSAVPLGDAAGGTESAGQPRVYISEVMSSNKTTAALPDGSFPDWLELHNAGAEPVELTGYVLRCGGDSWTFPAGRLEAGEYAVLWCDGSDVEGHCGFSISKEGEALALLTPEGATVDECALPALESDRSYCREEDGEGRVSRWPTPGYENSAAGYEAWQSERLAPERDLAIGEVMVYNEWYLPQTVGGEKEYYDWVEIVNLSDRTLELKNYFLSDREKTRLLFRLPEQVLKPGESCVVFCSEERGGGAIAPFDLGAGGETLYLSRKDGVLCDYVGVRDLPLGASMGREAGRGGFFYYAAPSPGTENREGVRFTGTSPEALSPDGVFEGVKEVTVELTGEGEIRYTLDGSVPTETSALYTGPLTVKKTAVLRAVSFRDGCLPSEPLNLSYVLNEGHTLPVVSVVCDPEDLFGTTRGIYSNPYQRWEKPGAVMFYEDGGAFRLACGVKLHGATSREQDKKSFKLSFRDRYDGRLRYDLFDNGVSDFKSVLLRADQESEQSTQMRDNLMHQLAMQAFPELPVQDNRYVVLYLNGAYWGVYSLREAHSEAHYAAHYGYDEDSVSQWKESWPAGSLPDKVYDFATHNDLSKAENYAYVAEHVNVDSVIAWCIMQIYSGNFDFNSPNMRFYYSTQDEQLRYALVDLDLGMYSYGDFAQLLGFGYAYTTLASRLMNNAQFRREFLRQLADAINGPLSDESALAMIDALAAELEPEIARDHARWIGSLESWQGMVEHLRDYIRQNAGRAGNVLELLQMSGYVSYNEMKEFFPDLKYVQYVMG